MAEGQNQPPAAKKPILQFWRCFWLTFLFVSLAYAWYCFYVPSNEIAWVKSHDVALRKAAEDKKPVILYFTGKWCVPCRIMKRIVWADSDVAETVNSGSVPVMIDVGDPNSIAAMKLYGVGAAPTTVVIDSDGNVLGRKYGSLGKAEFLEFIRKVESSSAQLE